MNDKIYEYPQNLIDFLTEQGSEGSEIFICQSSEADEVIFYIIPSSLENWLIICSWGVYMDDFSIINITGKAFDRMEKIIKEMKQ
jgi:hypothetical protein